MRCKASETTAKVVSVLDVFARNPKLLGIIRERIGADYTEIVCAAILEMQDEALAVKVLVTHSAINIAVFDSPAKLSGRARVSRNKAAYMSVNKKTSFEHVWKGLGCDVHVVRDHCDDEYQRAGLALLTAFARCGGFTVNIMKSDDKYGAVQGVFHAVTDLPTFSAP